MCFGSAKHGARRACCRRVPVSKKHNRRKGPWLLGRAHGHGSALRTSTLHKLPSLVRLSPNEPGRRDSGCSQDRGPKRVGDESGGGNGYSLPLAA